MATIEEKAKAYDNIIEKANKMNSENCEACQICIEELIPELRESEDEKIRMSLIELFKDMEWDDSILHDYNMDKGKTIAWLEKQGSEPNWCHHKVDLSDCSEEYRKAYYDGWNNCNMQHSQCRSESNDVIKCLINGMKFYYEDNKEATWGTEKFSMKVKDILSWLEKQGESTDINPSEFDLRLNKLLKQFETLPKEELANSLSFYLNVVQNDGTYVEEKQGEQNPAEWHREDEQNLNACLGYIPDEFLRRWLTDIIHVKYDKPAWSEEDENLFRCAIDAVKQESKVRADGCLDEEVGEMVINWLKSLKNRVCCEANCTTTKEWSEEDENIRKYILSHFQEHLNKTEEFISEGLTPPFSSNEIKMLETSVNRLKSFRPQKQWKPSELQIEALESATANCAYSEYEDCLKELIKQLKQL